MRTLSAFCGPFVARRCWRCSKISLRSVNSGRNRQPWSSPGRGGHSRASLLLCMNGEGASSAAPRATRAPPASSRTAQVHRVTRETDVRVWLNIDGTGECRVRTGIPFLDHMLHQISAHGLIDLDIQASGDYEIDDHHTNEDVGIALGLALAQALGDKRGIQRFGHFLAPLDEALVQVAMDFSGRGYLDYGLVMPTERVGTYDTQLVREFFMALASNAQMTLHIRQLAGLNTHHIIEASFKAFARALRMACEIDSRRQGEIPSSKGALTDQQALRNARGT